MSAIYAISAPNYAGAGLVSLPVNAAKKPTVRGWLKFGTDSYKRLLPEHSMCNIAVLSGRRVTCVDIDDPSLIDGAIERFGETPVKVVTPSGGMHLWYQSSGERRQTRLEGLKLDILGQGGFGVVPPSRSHNGSYEFIEGGLADLDRLPRLKGLDLQALAPANDLMPRIDPFDNTRGNRNNHLFYAIKGAAVDCETEAELMFRAEQINESMPDPLSEGEVLGTVKSVWHYKTDGRLFVRGSEATAFVPKSELEALTNDEVGLLVRLRVAHGANGGRPFVLAASAAPVLGFKTPRAMRKAQDGLEAKEYIAVPQKGEKGSHQKTIVRLLK